MAECGIWYEKVDYLPTVNPCGHNEFHYDCLLPWTSARGTCPMCMGQVSSVTRHPDEQPRESPNIVVPLLPCSRIDFIGQDMEAEELARHLEIDYDDELHEMMVRMEQEEQEEYEAAMEAWNEDWDDQGTDNDYPDEDYEYIDYFTYVDPQNEDDHYEEDYVSASDEEVHPMVAEWQNGNDIIEYVSDHDEGITEQAIFEDEDETYEDHDDIGYDGYNYYYDEYEY